MGLSFTIAAGSRQCIHSRIRVLWNWRPYFTAPDSRLPFLSPPMTRRATVEVFDPAFTRETINLEPRSPYLFPQEHDGLVSSPALGTHSVTFYDSQGYGGGNSNPPPHPGGPVCYALTHKFEVDLIQNSIANF
jgi:hypothetical protein